MHASYSKHYRQMFAHLITTHQQQHQKHSVLKKVPKSPKHLDVDKHVMQTGTSSPTSYSYNANENNSEFISMEELHEGADVHFRDDYELYETAQIETDRIFCSPKTILYSIFTIVFFSFLLAFPQIFAYEIKQNEISISPSKIPDVINTIDSSQANIYFVEPDNYLTSNRNTTSSSSSRSDQLFRVLNRTSLSYSHTVG